MADRHSNRSTDDGGFTLIELMVVLLILAILLAIAIPTFLGVTKSANDRAAQSNLNTALTSVKAVFEQNGQSYALGTPTAGNLTANENALTSSLSTVEPNLTFTTGSASTTSATVSVTISTDGHAVILAAWAKGTKNCWYVVDNSQAETAYAPWSGAGAVFTSPGTYYGEVKTALTCAASSAPAGANNITHEFLKNSFPNL